MIDTLVQQFTFGAVTASDIASGFRGNVWELVLYAGPMVKFVLLVLLFLSVVSWGIIFMKFRLVRAAIRESELFLGIFWETSQLSKIFGVYVDKAPHHYETIFRVIVAAIDYTHWPTVGMAAISFTTMIGLRRINPRIPNVLVAVVVTVIV